MMIDPIESPFRARMKALAHKGGAVTKRRHGYDPRYYRDIGRLGGVASVAARKARIAAELDRVKPCEGPTVEAPVAHADAPVTAPIEAAPDVHATVRRTATAINLLASRDRFGPRRAEVSERQRILDAIAEEHLARVIAGLYDANEPEPWDPWV
ncbi:MAG: hypothetical protein WA215_11945 [Candidatus Cybelea sp.]